MKLSSSAFEHGGSIPSVYTCDGDPSASSEQGNINPPLELEDVPDATESLVLIMDDPDIPDAVKEKMGIDVFDHWIVFNIPASVRRVNEGEEPEGVKGAHSGGGRGYTGPCPPDAEHRYIFRVYALRSLLELPEGSSKAQVEKAMDGLVLDSAELVGRYERK